MLSEKQTFRLMLMSCGPYLLISGAGLLAASGVLAFVGRELMTEAFVMVTLLKMGLAVMSVALLRMLSRGREDYFYINLGQHPTKLLKMAVSLDAAVYISLCMVIMLLRYVFFS